jgi:hypothetical protein
VRGSNEKYIGYRGYKVCDPPVNNPTVSVVVNGSVVYWKKAPDENGYYGEEVSIGTIDAEKVEFRVHEEDVSVEVDEPDIPPQGIDDLFMSRYVNVWFALRTDEDYGIFVEYYWSNSSSQVVYMRGEVYRGDEVVCQVSDSVDPYAIKNIDIVCDSPGRGDEIRIYKIKWYMSTDSSRWYHIETRLVHVYYYEPGKTVGDMLFRPNPMVYAIEEYTGKQFRNYGMAGSEYDYVLMICSMDRAVHKLEDDLEHKVLTVWNKCRWEVYSDTYGLGVETRNIYLDDNPYKEVNVYGYGGGKIRRVVSRSGYNVYTIDADNAVVISAVGDYAFDFINGVKDVDVSQAYGYGALFFRGWRVVNSDEYFVGHISDGSQYVSEYDRNQISIRFDREYSGRIEVVKDGNVVHSEDVNIPAGGTYRYEPLTSGKWSVGLVWGPVTAFKILKSETSLSLSVQPL